MLADVTMPEGLQTVITFLFSQMTTVITTVTGNPVLLIFVGVAVIGAGIGLVSRLFHAL